MKVFKTKEFARVVRKERLDDLTLCEAVERTKKGLVDAVLGKFLIKQRIARRNQGRSQGYRAIIFFQDGKRAVFLHMFAKNEQGNLTPEEQEIYRDFAKSLATLTAEKVADLVKRETWIEIDYESYQRKVSQ